MRELLSTQRTFIAVLFLGLFAMAARNATDPDLGWHLKTGEFISAQRSVPHTDIYSYTRAGQPWVTHEWLTEVLLYQIQRLTGFAGLVVLFAAVLCAAFFLLYQRCGKNRYIAGLGTLCGALATAPLSGVRPQIVSLLLTSVWLLLLERSEANPKVLWWTLPLTLLWANIHAGFAVGLVLSALFLFGSLIDRAITSRKISTLRTSALVLGCDLLLVPLNPNGLHLFSYPIETLRSKAMQTYILEWFSPNFHHSEYWPFLLIILVTIVCLAWSKLTVRPQELLLLLASLYASLTSIRMIPLFILIAVPNVCRRIGDWPVRTGDSRPPCTRPTVNTTHFAANGFIIAFMAIFAAVRISQVIRSQPEVESRTFPTRAVAFLQEHPPTGRIFNHYDWGGYLIWKLYPSVPVFIDGRADVYGESLFHDFADAYQLKSNWREILQRWQIQTVLIPMDSALAAGLHSAPGWTVAYQDSQAIIFTSAPVVIGNQRNEQR